MELQMDCLTSRILLRKVCSYKCQFCRKVWASWRLQGWSLKFISWTEQNVKTKYLMCQIPIKMLEHHAIPNSSLPNLKIYSSKGCRKTSQRWIICMYLPNTAVLNIGIFSRTYHFRLWVLASTGEYFHYWHWRVLHSVPQIKWCQDL